MAFNGSGIFSRIYNFVNDAANSINIRADRMDAEFDGIASGLSNCITRDGQGKPSGAMDWNGQNLNNVNTLGAATGVFSTQLTVPTPAAGDNSAKAAPTSFVQGFAGGRKQVYPTGATFTVPDGVSLIYVTAAAGGGGGAGGGGAINVTGTGAGGAGGGAGQSIQRNAYVVTPGQAIAISIGGSGSGGTAGTPSLAGGTGGNGGNTVIGSLVTLLGGNGGNGGGTFVNAGVPAGGLANAQGYPAGSSGNDGATGFNGGVGAGGAGAGNPFGGGGGGGRAGSTGINGAAAGGYGCGGGAGGGGYGGAGGGANGGSGGAGTSGIVIIEY